MLSEEMHSLKAQKHFSPLFACQKIYRGLTATATPEEKLEGLTATLKASHVEVQIVKFECDHQIVDLQMKLQPENLPEVRAKRVSEVKQATDSIIAAVT